MESFFGPSSKFGPVENFHIEFERLSAAGCLGLGQKVLIGKSTNNDTTDKGQRHVQHSRVLRPLPDRRAPVIFTSPHLVSALDIV